MMLPPPVPLSRCFWSLGLIALSDQFHRAVVSLSLHNSAWAPSSALHPNTPSLLISVLPGPFFIPSPGLSQSPIFLQEVVYEN